MTVGLPEEPENRKETYLAYIAGQEIELPEEPANRIESYLAYIAENGSGGGGGGGGGGTSVGATIFHLDPAELGDINPGDPAITIHIYKDREFTIKATGSDVYEAMASGVLAFEGADHIINYPLSAIMPENNTDAAFSATGGLMIACERILSGGYEYIQIPDRSAEGIQYSLQ